MAVRDYHYGIEYERDGYYRRRDEECWVNPDRRRTKQSHPYSYDEFFIFGDRASAQAAKDAVYSDRLWQWDHEKARRIHAKFNKRFEHFSAAECSAWLSEYFG